MSNIYFQHTRQYILMIGLISANCSTSGHSISLVLGRIMADHSRPIPVPSHPAIAPSHPAAVSFVVVQALMFLIRKKKQARFVLRWF